MLLAPITKLFQKTALPLFMLATSATLAIADEASVKKIMEKNLETKVESVTASGYLGLYEVFADGHIFYTDEKANVFIVGGQLVDPQQKKNITNERMQKLTAIRFDDLPLNQAIKQVRGNGKRVIASFEDPNCGYCKHMAKSLQELDNVTHYVFLYPILSEDSLKKSKQIWCASSRTKAWNDWMVENKSPSGKDDCDTKAIGKNVEWGRRLNITGTPTVFFKNGERVPGALSLQQMEERLNATTP